MIKVYESDLSKLDELRQSLINGEISFADIYNKFVNTGDYSSMSYAIEWGFAKDDLEYLVERYKKGNGREKDFIIDLLEDCNFHRECKYLMDGDYDEVIR